MPWDIDAVDDSIAKEELKKARNNPEYRWEDLDLQRIEGEKITTIDTKERDKSITK